MLFYCGNQWGYTPVGKILNIPTTFCNPPTGLSVSIYAQFATLQWVAPHDYLKFVLEYRIVGSPTWTSVDVYGQSYVVALSPLANYEWQVKTVCATAPLRESTFAVGPVFLTHNAVAGCTPVSSVQVIYLGNRYRFQWTATGASFYTVEVRMVGTSIIRTYTTQNNFYEIYSLTPGETYEVRVTATCQNVTMVPVPSPWVQWTVANLTCPSPGSINSTKGTTSILISWPSAGIGYTYNVYLNNIPAVIAFPGNVWTFTPLIPGTTYNIKVVTNCGNGLSPAQDINLTTDPLPCAPPTALVVVPASVTPGGFDITWVPGAGILSQQIILNNGAPIAIGAAIATHSFTGLTPGSNNTVVVRSICTGNVSPDATVSQALTGCAAVTGLVATPSFDRIAIKWNPVANAVTYKVTVTKISDSSIAYSASTPSTLITVHPLDPTTDYKIDVTTECAGGALGTLVTVNSTTIAIPACMNAIIDTQVIRSTSIDILTWHFADGRTTGFFEYRLIRVSDSAQIANGQQSTITPIQFTNLTASTAYKVYIFDRGASGTLACTPTEIATITTQVACLPPATVSTTMSAGNDAITVAITPSPSAPPFYSIAYSLTTTIPSFTVINNIPAASFPYTIMPVAPGRYEVQIASYCTPTNASNAVIVRACPKPLNVVGVTIPGGIHVTWDALAGVTKFIVYLTNQVTQITSEYISNTNVIDILDLTPGIAYAGYVRAVCVDNLNTGIDSDPFNATSGQSVPGGERVSCIDPEFTAYVQDCEVTDPGGIGGGGGGGIDGGGGGGVGADCNVTAQDWALVNALFAEVSDDAPNDTFLEATFEIAQSIGAGILAAMPGGIMGVINAACLPASTASVGIEVVLGGTLEVGAGTYATNGNITVAGSYTSDGSTRLVVRLRGNYNKV